MKLSKPLSDFMRNDVLQNYLDQFLKCLAENFDNLKFQDASNVVIILHCGPKLYMYKLQENAVSLQCRM